MILDRILQSKVIAIIRGVPPEKVVETVSALGAGGILCCEVTFDHSGSGGVDRTLQSIALLKERFGDDIALGAGTVISPEEVRLAEDAGAAYIISPHTDRGVIEAAKKRGLVSIPGAMTATEVVEARRAGADLVKLFPAARLGEAYIKDLRGPLGDIPMVAVGGIHEENFRRFLELGCAGVGIGGNLVNPKRIAEGRFDELTALARRFSEGAQA